MKIILAVFLCVLALSGCETVQSKNNKSDFNISYDKADVSNDCKMDIVISKNNKQIFNQKEDCLSAFSINNLSDSKIKKEYLNFDVFVVKNDSNTYLGQISASSNENVVLKTLDGDNQIEVPNKTNEFMQRFSVKSGNTYRLVKEDVVFELTISNK